MSTPDLAARSPRVAETSDEAQDDMAPGAASRDDAETNDADTHDLERVLGDLGDAAREQDETISVGDALDAFATRSFGAILTVFALIAALPLVGAIPGVSIITGTMIILTAGQFLIGRETPWTPQRVRELSIDAETLEKAIRKSRPYAAAIDRWIRPRLSFLTDNRIARTAIALASLALAATFFPLAIVPGGVFAPALSILALGLAMLGRDGALALVGYGGVALTGGLLLWAA